MVSAIFNKREKGSEQTYGVNVTQLHSRNSHPSDISHDRGNSRASIFNCDFNLEDRKRSQDSKNRINAQWRGGSDALAKEEATKGGYDRKWEGEER